ncbi:MAG: EcsC family protein [Propionibacteriaceae bacterium]|jgi:uncharacterized protein (DUF697 family)|nr:EcsC family protein [Propionibacteriaceae bacterium]
MPSGKLLKGVATQVAGGVLVGLPHLAPDTFGGWLLKLIDTAVDGTGRLPGAKRVAGSHLARHRAAEPAIDALIRLHIALASAQGFVTNVAGGLASLVGMPANLVGIVVVQIRLVASIAHLHGYDIDDPRVRTALVMCLLGEKEINKQVAAGQLPSTPLAVATAAVIDDALANQVAARVLQDVLGTLATKDLAGFIIRKVPLLGGGVGAVVDAYSTRRIAHYARRHLVIRRPVQELAPGAEQTRWHSPTA